MKIINRLYVWYGKTVVITVFLVVIILIGILLFISFRNSDSGNGNNKQILRIVKVASVLSLVSENSIELIGKVESVNQAEIGPEVSGRVTQVNVALGDTIEAGQTIAQLENANERASVLQAEGAYEATLAVAAQNDVSVEATLVSLRSAKDNTVTVYRSSYITAEDIVRNLTNEMYSDPTRKESPGLRIDGNQYTTFLNRERVAFEEILKEWKNESTLLTTESELDTALNNARSNTLRLFEFIDILSKLISVQTPNNKFSETVLASLKVRFQAARVSLTLTVTNIDNARTTLLSAIEARKKAEIAGTGADLSVANANVKQALGSLHTAQANLAKTILRSPISGTVNELKVKTGDFLNAFTHVALIANNNALEITTFVGENDRDTIHIGDTVTIEGAYDGTVTNIAPAVDTDTRKVEVKIAAETNKLVNGDTVRITIAGSRTEQTEDIYLPLTSIKFSAENGFVFLIDDTKLVAKNVVLGAIRGSTVQILEGITIADVIVIDARGLTAGQQVEATDE